VASSEAQAEHRLWGGRFSGGLAPEAERLNRSLPVDYRLWPHDLRAARAWARALYRAAFLDATRLARILEGLDVVEQRLTDGAAIGAPDEDVHTLIERLLFDVVGDLAGALNTGRSRNDQVATDLRLWCRDAVAALDREVASLAWALHAKAADGIEVVLPGYTHGQRAQPVRWAYVLLAHAWPLVRDRGRLAAAAHRGEELPLGAGALAGSGVAVDRAWLCGELGFARVAPNALDVTGDRDFATDLVFAAGLIAQHVARLAAELALYASGEFGFIRLADGYATGSSLMPQKRNPDIFELARGKGARIVGDLITLLQLPRGLPAGYHKDLQEDKPALFDAVDQLLLTLPAVRGAVATLEPVPERMRAALDPLMLATDLADGLAARTVPFRDAHRMIGELVRVAATEGVPLTDVPATVAARVHPALPELLASLGSWEASVERRSTVGGSSREAVQRQLAELEQVLDGSGTGTHM
jgi:argininosuccinate lyase